MPRISYRWSTFGGFRAVGRRNPDVSSDAMAIWLPATGIDYRSDLRLGGRRHLPAADRGEDPWWQVEAFAAYAAHTRTATFRDAFDELLSEAEGRRTAMMCSEAVWWRCHRRLIADVAVLSADIAVDHLMHDGRVHVHAPATGARLRADGQVIWDDR
jgi:uncharacterized protein (DUF488 family)